MIREDVLPLKSEYVKSSKLTPSRGGHFLSKTFH